MINRSPRHRTLSSSEKFGYRPFGAGRVSIEEAIGDLRRATQRNSHGISLNAKSLSMLADTIKESISSHTSLIGLVDNLTGLVEKVSR